MINELHLKQIDIQSLFIISLIKADFKQGHQPLEGPPIIQNRTRHSTWDDIASEEARKVSSINIVRSCLTLAIHLCYFMTQGAL